VIALTWSVIATKAGPAIGLGLSRARDPGHIGT